MQTERVTFLTSPDQKAALDAFAKGSGMSVGRVLREASSQYMAEAPLGDDDKLAILVAQLNEAVPAIAESFDRMITLIDSAHDELRQLRAERAGLRAQ
ncbi:MAG: hypothetical protein K2Y20_00045 [Sphingomonas sp.]|nr:hypothetical protein [Sphingomonas sp.]